MTTIMLIGGLVLLVGGGELLVRGAVRIAEHARLSPMLIGLTIVGMGTSTPELATSVQAALSGSSGIAVGNIVGSNLANLLLILGIAALLSPLAVQRGALWRDGGLGLLAAFALLAAGATVGLGRIAGVAFLLILIGYLVYAYRQERLGAPHSAAYDKALAAEEVDGALLPQEKARSGLLRSGLLFLIGLGCVMGGASLLVTAAIALAEGFGMSETAIGLTIVAVGTSLPELVTSAVAAVRKQSEVALGNVLGSNIYNILFIGGVTGLVAPTDVPAAIMRLDLWLLIGASAAVLLFAYTGGRLSRREGAVLVACYALYAAVTADFVAMPA